MRKKQAFDELYLAANRGDLRAVEKLLVAGAPVNPPRKAHYSPLYTAAWRGYRRIVRRLLDAGARIRPTPDLDALWVSSGRGQTNIVTLLLDAGADPNKHPPSKDPPLYVAAQERHLQVMKALLAAGADPNTQANCLFGALHIHDLYNERRFPPTKVDRRLNAVLKLLLKGGAHVNATTGDDWTPLHIALSLYPYNYRLLLEAGADIHARDKFLQTPLFCANASATKSLIKARADVHARSGAGRTPLWDCKEGEKAALLLRHGADPLEEDDYGRTPFEWAIQRGRLDVARQMWHYTKDRHTRASMKQTGLELARQAKQTAMVKFFRARKIS